MQYSLSTICSAEPFKLLKSAYFSQFKTTTALNISGTVKPALSGHRIKRTPSIKRTVAKVPKFFPLFTLNETFI